MAESPYSTAYRNALVTESSQENSDWVRAQSSLAEGGYSTFSYLDLTWDRDLAVIKRRWDGINIMDLSPSERHSLYYQLGGLYKTTINYQLYPA